MNRMDEADKQDQSPNSQYRRWTDWLFALGLVIAVFVAYKQSWQGGFVWDDELHLLNNPVLKPGGLAAAWVPGGYLSALAKGTAITLPSVLLACAWWQRSRIERRDLLRVLPYVAISAVMSAFEVWGQQHVAEHVIVRTDGFLSRGAVAGCAIWFYLGKLIAPLNLCPFYPRWTIGARNVLSYLPGVAWVGLLACAWWKRRTWGRPVVMLSICYSALLLPVLGFVNIYFMRYSFYQTTIARNPNCWLAYNNLGTVLLSRGDIDAATTDYRKSVEINPDFAEAQNNFGNVLAMRGQLDSAISHYRKALEIKPDYAEASYDLGKVLLARGQKTEAIALYQDALNINPNYAEAQCNLATVLFESG